MNKDKEVYFAGEDVERGDLLYKNRDGKLYICRPEPAEPLIMDSGDTIVCEWTDGINYICMDVEENTALMEAEEESFETIMKLCWKSFTGENPDITELTDEHAKLRPMVVIQNDNGSADTRKLTYIDENIIQCKGVTYSRSIIDATDSTRLATAKELQGSRPEGQE